MKYDLHMHSHYSWDSFNKPADIVKAAKKAGLSGIAVTDHKTIKGSLAAKKANKDKDFEVVVAEEVMTDVGEILAYYVQDEIPLLPIMEALDRLKSQGAVMSVAHPFSRGILRQAFTMEIDQIKHKIHALEGWNARMITKKSNYKAELVADKYNLGLTAGSDAHFLREIGRGYVEFEGSLEKAIKHRRTRIGGTNTNAFFYRAWTLKNIAFKKYSDIPSDMK